MLFQSRLLRLAQSRDADAWSVIMDRGGPLIVDTARRLTGDADLAQDAVQECLLQVRDGARTFRRADDVGDGGARQWLARVVANAALQLVRRRAARRRRDAIAGRIPRHDHVDAEGLAIQAEDADLLRAALADLPEPTRAAIALHHLHGEGYAAIANLLGISEGAVRVRVHRGLATLRTRLTAAGVDGPSAVVAALVGLAACPANASGAAAPAMPPALLTASITSTVPAINATAIGASMGATLSFIMAIATSVAVIPLALAQDVRSQPPQPAPATAPARSPASPVTYTCTALPLDRVLADLSALVDMPITAAPDLATTASTLDRQRIDESGVRLALTGSAKDGQPSPLLVDATFTGASLPRIIAALEHLLTAKAVPSEAVPPSGRLHYPISPSSGDVGPKS